MIFGGITTGVNILVYLLCTRMLNVDEMISNVAAWALAVLFSFITNKFFVFQSRFFDKKAFLKEFYSFTGCRLLTGLFDMVFMYVFIRICSFNDILVKIGDNIIVILLNYLASKFWIFRKEGESNADTV